MAKLTPKQERFVQEYLIDLNATKAAIRAGYSAKTARELGHRQLTKVDISRAIEEAQAKRAEHAELTADAVIDELRKIAFANMADYMKSTPHGDPYLDFSALNSRPDGCALRGDRREFCRWQRRGRAYGQTREVQALRQARRLGRPRPLPRLFRDEAKAAGHHPRGRFYGCPRYDIPHIGSPLSRQNIKGR